MTYGLLAMLVAWMLLSAVLTFTDTQGESDYAD